MPFRIASICVSLKHPALVIALTAGLSSTAIGFFASAGTDTPRFENAPARVATAVFAGGCMSCIEAEFDKVPGVIETLAGYTGGTAEDPSARQVERGGTGHYEAVKVTYNPSKVSYSDLAAYFVRQIDPTDAGGQFCDQGEAHRSAIFVSGQGERDTAEKVLTTAGRTLGQDVATEILPTATFWPAEASRQDYARRYAEKYEATREACGRDAGLKALWGPAGTNS
ncbi:MAG TPA: peptide-methionine (S)-S-oxide reductase MsrA [Hyphomonas sp.]|nr:peptide-methionine (S)-S-oxide reductase [Hyphomonas sp.]HRK69095.1 peptide-methionine (S)-S-oxide reductase MsrA [Hyphomonas sp.]